MILLICYVNEVENKMQSFIKGTCFDKQPHPQIVFKHGIWVPEVESCVAIKQNQSEVGSIDCEIQPEKRINFFLFSIALRILQFLIT